MTVYNMIWIEQTINANGKSLCAAHFQICNTFRIRIRGWETRLLIEETLSAEWARGGCDSSLIDENGRDGAAVPYNCAYIFPDPRSLSARVIDRIVRILIFRAILDHHSACLRSVNNCGRWYWKFSVTKVIAPSHRSPHTAPSLRQSLLTALVSLS